MPQVPTYGNLRVSTAPLPGAYRNAPATPESYGAGFGRAAANIFGGMLAEDIARDRAEADEIALLAADNQLAQFENRALRDPKAGALGLQGAAAFGSPERVDKEYVAFSDKVMEGLNERQQAQFRRAVASRRASISAQLHQHVQQEAQQYDVDETTSYLNNVLQTGIANATTPALVAMDAKRGVAAIQQFARRHGEGPNVTTEKVQTWLTSLHVGVIDNLLSQHQDIAARGYFEDVIDQLQPSQVDDIRRALESGELREQSQRVADQILLQSDSREEALDKVRQITEGHPENAQLRDEVMTRVRQGLNDRAQAQAQADEDRFVAAINEIETSKSVDTISPLAWQKFTLAERNGLKAYADQLRSGSPAETDWELYNNLYGMLRNNLERFKGLNLYSYIHRLAPTEFKELVRVQADARVGGSDSETVRAVTLDSELFQSIAAQAGLPAYRTATQLSTAQREQLGELENTWKREIGRAQVEKGNTLTREEKEEIGRRLIDQKVYLDRNYFFSDPEVPMVTVSERDQAIAYIPIGQIPEINIDELANLFRSEEGRPNLSTAEIRRRYRGRLERAYAAYLMGLGADVVLSRLRGE